MAKTCEIAVRKDMDVAFTVISLEKAPKIDQYSHDPSRDAGGSVLFIFIFNTLE